MNVEIVYRTLIEKVKVNTYYCFVAARVIQEIIMTYASIANHMRGECRKCIVVKLRDNRAW